jgi:hypothetical protein
MTARKYISVKERLEVVVAQATCPACGERLGNLSNVRFDHIHALALGGADHVSNLRAIHVACHDVKTFGTRATTAGSDIQQIAKSRRLTKSQEEFRQRVLSKSGQAERPERKTSKWKWRQA